MFLESDLSHPKKGGSIEVICGSMFSGKTEELLRRLKRSNFAKLKIETFKPAIDTRYDNINVVSHDENFIKSTIVKNSYEILELIKKLTKERNLAVILITHDMGVIAETTDRVAVMKNGDLVEIGPTKQVLVEPKEKYTKSLVSSVPPTNKKISRFTIIEKENLNNQNNNIKILNRWSKKSIVDQNLVKIQNLSKSFDDSFFTENTKNSVMAVDDVSFDIKEGKSFGLVGESGSGKTTIAKMVVNLFKPSSGDIFFDNVNVTKIKKNKDLLKFRRQIQMIFQDPFSSLNGRLKVKEIIAEPIKLHDPNIKSIDLDNYIFDLLESVELSQQSAIRYPHEFSGGQRQRLSLIHI